MQDSGGKNEICRSRSQSVEGNKSIYMEAFPKGERKPFFVLKHSVKRRKARVFTASDENRLLGFAVAIPYQNMVMVDYLAVSGKDPEQKNGSFIMQEICQYFSDKKVVPPDRAAGRGSGEPGAEDRQKTVLSEKRIHLCGYCGGSRRGYGDPEFLEEGISGGLYAPSKYALGRFLFSLSGMRIVEPSKGVRKPQIRGHNSSTGFI